MRIHLDEIPETGLRVESEEKAADFPVLDELPETEFIDPLTVDLFLQRAGQMVEMRGRLRTRLSMTCSRCLKNFVQPLDAEIRLLYARRPETAVYVREMELTTEDVGLMLFDGDIIDTYQAIYEETLASVPAKPLCRPDCKGLCSKCGKDLNKGPCRCETEEVDPRLAVLKRFKEVKNR